MSPAHIEEQRATNLALPLQCRLHSSTWTSCRLFSIYSSYHLSCVSCVRFRGRSWSHWNAGGQRAEPDAERERDGARCRRGQHQDTVADPRQTALGPQAALVPIQLNLCSTNSFGRYKNNEWRGTVSCFV